MEAGQSYVRKLITFLKVILLPATFGFIAYKLVYAYNINDLFGQARLQWNFTTFSIMAATIALMLLQWVLEARKWQLLVSRNETTTYTNAFKGILAGAALNILTPNQLGDFVGRILYLKQTGKIKGTLVTVIGHTAQVIMTAAFGMYGFLWLMWKQGLFQREAYLIFNIVWSVLVIAALIGFIQIRFIARLKLPARVAGYLDVFTLYNSKELLALLLMSLARYGIFVLQYFLLAQLFSVEVTTWQCIACVTAMMCAQSFVPSFILIELGMRGASALWFFGMFTSQVAPVLLTTYTLWIVNAMIPGLAGLFFLLKWRASK